MASAIFEERQTPLRQAPSTSRSGDEHPRSIATVVLTDGVGRGSERNVNIEAKYLLDADDSSVAFAVRVINIPDSNKDTNIYARPYYVYECDGVEMIVYGDIDVTTFQAEADKTNS